MKVDIADLFKNATFDEITEALLLLLCNRTIDEQLGMQNLLQHAIRDNINVCIREMKNTIQELDDR